MKVLVLYRPKSAHGRAVDEFAHEFAMRHPNEKLELTDIDSREGAELAKVYDIVEYPAIIALRQDGSVQNTWIGSNLPLLDEVYSYVRG